MAKSQNGDSDNNCFFDTPTKTQILEELSFVQNELSEKSECDDLALKIGDVIQKLQSGDFRDLT